jgi:hypothetical protein
LRGRAEKQPITREQFDNDLVDSPFLKSFRYGKNHEGYWTNRHMKLQLEDVVDCLRVAFPFDFLFLVKRKKIEGWAGKPKGLFQVLWETGWIDPELPRSKYNKAEKNGRDFDENGKLKPEIAHLILTNLMASRPDFAVEKSDLEHLVDELGCIVNFTAKYHCEIAGEGVENGWGFSKKIYRRLPIAKKRYLAVFTKSMKHCLIQVTPERARRFSRRCRKYMLAYQKIVNEADGESTATASLERIETLVDTCFVATTNLSKKKRKKLVGSGPTKKDLNRRLSVETIYSIQGTKVLGPTGAG